MRLKDVKDFFFENIKEFNDTYGFVSKKTAFKLVKKTDYGSIEIDFTYNTFYDEIELDPCLSIYHNKVDAIASLCNSWKIPAVAMYILKLKVAKEKGERHIQKAAEERELYFHIMEDTYQDDILKAIDELTYIYERYGKYEVDRFASLEEVYSVFTHKPIKYSYYHTAWEFQAIVGLITAKLLNKKDYDKLVTIYYKQYKKHFAFTLEALESFECLIEKLSEIEH